MAIPGGPIYKDDLVYAGHVLSEEGQGPLYLGYLMAETRRHTAELSDLTDTEAQALGLLVARLSRALKACVGAEHIYSFVLGHHIPHLHIHVVARYPGAPREYWGVHVDEWPDAPHGGPEEIKSLCERLRIYLKNDKGDDPLFAGKESDFLLAEYDTLRAELLQRTSTRSQIINLALTAFGAVLGAAAIGSQGIYFLMLYPLVALFLLNSYLSNSLKIQRIGDYIKDHIEKYARDNLPSPVGSIFSWQDYYDKQSKQGFIKGRFIFPLTALIATGVGIPSVWSKIGLNLEGGFVVIGVVSLLASWILAIWKSRFYKLSK